MVSLSSLVGVSCGPLQLACTLQTMLMTYGIFRLCLYPGDSQGLKLLLAGQAADPAFWLNPAKLTRVGMVRHIRSLGLG